MQATSKAVFASALFLGAFPALADRVNPPAYIGVPDHARSVTQRAITMVSSVAVAPNGRLWMTWYAGPTPAEDRWNYVVLATSDDDGRTWREVCVVDPDGEGPRRAFDPEVWVSPDGHVRWFWADRTGDDHATCGTWMMDLGDADAVPGRMPAPRCVGNGVMMCKPTVLKDGAWALPTCEWYSDHSAGVTVSTDGGKTWSFRGGACGPKEDRTFDEHNLVQKRNGDLWVLSRVHSGIREAVSHDDGRTWSPLGKSAIRHTSSRFFIRRLASGNLLLVKHGPVDRDVGRRDLMAFLSKDDGATWQGGLMIDSRSGVSYPDGDQNKAGEIYLTYDFDRSGAREINLVKFTEADVLAKADRKVAATKRIVSKGSGRPKIPTCVSRPDYAHRTDNRAHVGISSLAVSPKNGRLWATWYSGITPGEDQNNYCVLTTSADDGKTWKEVLVADPDGFWPRRAFDPELWISPDGKLRWTWTDRIGTVFSNPADDQLWMLTLDAENEPAGDIPVPTYVGPGVMMCKPTVLSTGEWAFPVARWQAQPSSCVYVTADGGKTFSLRGGAELPQLERLYDEHQIVEKRDGRLWCLSRTKTGIRESHSSDKGATWTPSEYIPGVKHTSSRFFIRRLASGNLLFVKHGPVGQDVGRKLLTAYVSRDDGATWEGGLLLDKRGGASYPDGQQAADGTVYLTYDFDRVRSREIFFCTFREEDVLAGKDVSGKVRLRQLVTKSRGIPNLKPVADNRDGVPAAMSDGGALATDAWQAVPLKEGEKLFTDRSYKVSPTELLPKGWSRAKFLRIPLMGEQTLTVARAGVVGVLTPQPNRNRDSLCESLEKQGFRKAALPEIRLFDPQNTGNFSTFYQKRCAAGEKVVVGKWGVPVWFE